MSRKSIDFETFQNWLSSSSICRWCTYRRPKLSCEDECKVWNSLPDCECGKWISVDDRLPESIGDVLVYSENPMPFIAWSFYNSNRKFATHDKIDETITHWMELPKPPKPNKESG